MMGWDRGSSEISSPGRGLWLHSDKVLRQPRALAHTGPSVSGELILACPRLTRGEAPGRGVGRGFLMAEAHPGTGKAGKAAWSLLLTEPVLFRGQE